MILSNETGASCNVIVVSLVVGYNQLQVLLKESFLIFSIINKNILLNSTIQITEELFCHLISMIYFVLCVKEGTS